MDQKGDVLTYLLDMVQDDPEVYIRWLQTTTIFSVFLDRNQCSELMLYLDCISRKKFVYLKYLFEINYKNIDVKFILKKV